MPRRFTPSWSGLSLSGRSLSGPSPTPYRNPARVAPSLMSSCPPYCLTISSASPQRCIGPRSVPDRGMLIRAVSRSTPSFSVPRAAWRICRPRKWRCRSTNWRPSSARPRLDELQQVRTWADRIQLKLPQADAKHLQLLTDLKREQESSRLKRGLEQDLRAYLTQDALLTPGSALVWWLAKNPDQVERSVELYPILKRLSEAAQGVPEERPVVEKPAGINGFGPQIFSSGESRPVEPLATAMPDYEAALEKLFEGCEEPERSYMASQLAYLEDSFERPERAARIREHFDVEPVAEMGSNATPPVAGTRTIDDLQSTDVHRGIDDPPSTDDHRSPDVPGEQDDGEGQPGRYREQFFAD